MKKSINKAILLTLIIHGLGSWGFLVHRTVNQLAVYQLPKPMRGLFYSHRSYLVENAPRPDIRRNDDSTEAPKHFIDLEMYGDSAAWKMPWKWEEAAKVYSRDSLLKYGYLPYHLITMKNKLTEAFRDGIADSILFYAADLGHYIGDANVPLHTSVNYDGQLSGQKGLHSLWESMIPELELDRYNLYSRHKAVYLSNPEEAVWQTIRRSYSLLGDVFGQEKEASKTFTDSTKYRFQTRRGREVRSYTTEFAKAYSQRLGATINEQLLHSANLIADFWYTAWVDAGRPDLSGLSKKEKKIFKSEIKALRKGELLAKGLLLAKKQQSAE